jgi:hypothetical protein
MVVNVRHQRIDKKTNHERRRVIMSRIGSLATSVYKSLPDLAFPKLRIDTPSNIIKKTTAIAMPMVLLLGSQYGVKSADAGPVFGKSWCLIGCLPLIEEPPLLAVCLAACGMVGIAPTPW